MDASCQCGSVRFKTPLPTPLDLWHCHCNDCRKQTASAFGTSAIFPAFQLPKDLPIASFERKTDSGRVQDCYFCTKCGVRLMHAARGGATVSVKGGLLEGLDWSKAKHIWCCRAVFPVPEGAETFERQPE